MLVDIFARRYESVPLRDAFEQRDIGLLVQAFRILSEDIYPYYQSGKEYEPNVTVWTNLQNRLSRELGRRELSPLWGSYTTKAGIQSFKYSLVNVCENWMMQPVQGVPDAHVKERLSLIELGFRERENQIAAINAEPIVSPQNALAGTGRIRLPGDAVEAARAFRAQKTAKFQESVDELNERFRQARYPLHYHNGFVQFSTDDRMQREVETPFWSVVSDPIWKNVDHDMKEALDLRDSGGRDPAFYAARALESTIKIISGKKGWTHGGEKGAHNYIDNLAAKKNAFIEPWESKVLKEYFSEVRNPLGHGPGDDDMRSLTRQQTEWAIEFCMAWIKNLARRL